jgi:hypothetical protein
VTAAKGKYIDDDDGDEADVWAAPLIYAFWVTPIK